MADTVFCINLSKAILFLCEVDNIAFALGVSERVRRRVETAGRVDLSDDEADAMAHMKVVHIVLIMVFVPASLLVAHVTASFGGCWVAMGPVWLGGVVEAFKQEATAGATAWRIGATALQAVTGVIVSLAIFIVLGASEFHV